MLLQNPFPFLYLTLLLLRRGEYKLNYFFLTQNLYADNQTSVAAHCSEMAKNLSKEQQLLQGLEILLLGNKWYIRGQSRNQLGETAKVGDMYIRFEEIHNIDDGNEEQPESDETDAEAYEKRRTSLQEILRKRYSNYIKEVESKFKVNINFQSKICNLRNENNETNFQIAKTIISKIAYSSSDDALKVALSNWEDKPAFLTFLIVLKYAIKFQFPIEFKYNKLMRLISSDRRVYPRSIALINGNLGIIAYDKNDQNTKSFLLGRIHSPKLDFYSDLLKSKENSVTLPNFDLVTYLSTDPNAKFQKQEITYTIWMAKNNLDFFKHTSTLPFEIKEEDSIKNFAIVEIKTFNEFQIFDLLFNYHTYAKLVGPPSAVENFKKKLKSLSEFYEEQTKKPGKKASSKRGK